MCILFQIKATERWYLAVEVLTYVQMFCKCVWERLQKLSLARVFSAILCPNAEWQHEKRRGCFSISSQPGTADWLGSNCAQVRSAGGIYLSRVHSNAGRCTQTGSQKQGNTHWKLAEGPRSPQLVLCRQLDSFWSFSEGPRSCAPLQHLVGMCYNWEFHSAAKEKKLQLRGRAPSPLHRAHVSSRSLKMYAEKEVLSSTFMSNFLG